MPRPRCLLLVPWLWAVLRAADRPIQRLPRALRPSQYTLHIRTDARGLTFTGNVTIDIDVKEETDNITMNGKGLTLRPPQIVNLDTGEALNVSSNMLLGDGVFTIPLQSAVHPGYRLRLSMLFEGKLNTNRSRSRGYYRVPTGPQENQWMSATAFEYNHAREAFPCFDEPEFKARFQISLTRHHNFSTLSNMPLLHSEFEDEAGEWVKDNFENSPVMSSYLVAFHIHNLDHRDVAFDGRRLSVWAPRRQLRWANTSLGTAQKAIDFFTTYTGIKDPMPKTDLVSVPKFPSALENWGVISFTPTALLCHGEGEVRRMLCVKVVSHELAHSWFGNLVTPRWWDGLWLSEGAASFFSSLAVDQMEPEWDQMTHDTQEHLMNLFYTNAAGIGRPLAHPVDKASDLASVRSAPYYRGFSLLRMMYYSLGPPKFKEGIRRYISDLLYKTTTPQLLYDAMNYSYEGHNMASLMDAWTYQTGLPVVFVNRSDGQLILTQTTEVVLCCPKATDHSVAVQMWIKNTKEEPPHRPKGTNQRFPEMSIRVEEGKEEEKERTLDSNTTGSKRKFQDAQPKLWFNTSITIPEPAKLSDWIHEISIAVAEEGKEKKERTDSWWVPVSYTTGSERKFQDAQPKLWFNTSITIPDPAKSSDWLLVNLLIAGTYHVRYDKANLELLKNTLNTSLEDIPVLNRMQLVLDYGLFALSGLESVPEVLDLMDFLKDEKHFAPWAAGLKSLWRMDQRLRGTRAGSRLKEKVRSLLIPQLSSLGLRTRKGDTMPVIHQRRQVVTYACLYKLADCVRRAERLFTKWMDQTDPDKVNPIPPDVRSTIYCTALRTGKEDYWKFMQERALRAKELIHRDTMFSALGCSCNYEQLYSFVESKLDNSSITRHDYTKLIQGLVQYNEDIGPVLKFMERSLLKMRSTTNKKLRWNQTMLKDLSHQIYEPEHLEQLKGLIGISKTWSKKEMAAVQRMVEYNASWREKNKNIL